MEMSATGLVFSPTVPLWVLAAFAVAILLFFLFSLFRGARGAWLRLLAGLALLAALADPKLSQELREPLSDVALLLIDESASQTIDGRAEITEQAAETLRLAAERLSEPGSPLELRVATVETAVGEASDDPGTRLFTAMETALADVGQDRIAGAIVVTDGRAHDAPDWNALDEDAIASRFPAPLHVLSTGRDDSYDRRLVVESAPAFGIVGEDVSIRLTVEDLGATPLDAVAPRVTLRVDGRDVRSDRLRVGLSTTMNARLEKGGASVFEVVVDELDGEITTRNNRALFTVRGARDRLRVLLVSGEPHAGERSWRNLLKADPSVDLVHFTILRPPSKMTGTPIRELSLIPFPTRELFMQKIDDFDLVIFDRYIRRGVLAPAYLQNVAAYVRKGGATLIAAGPDFGGPNSLYRSPLAEIMPATPTGGSVENFFTPRLTDPGAKHPVTAELPQASTTEPSWGRWARLIDIAPHSGDVLMAGESEEPLLVLDRVDEGRVAMLASDTAWLWSRGFEGGGPLAETLRRVAHWLMKEPQLEEDALTAEALGARIEITRRSLGDAPETAQIVTPSGERASVPFTESGPGRWRSIYEAEEAGLFSITDGTLDASAAVGPTSPKEFENPLASFDVLRPVTAVTGGAEVMLRAGIPDLRRVAGQRKTSGTGWIGLRERGAYVVRDATLTPLAPGWLALLIAAGLLLLAWRIEGR